MPKASSRWLLVDGKQLLPCRIALGGPPKVDSKGQGMALKSINLIRKKTQNPTHSTQSTHLLIFQSSASQKRLIVSTLVTFFSHLP